MQPQMLINYFNDYNRFIDSLPRNGYNHEFYIIIKSVTYETYMFYRNSWGDATNEDIRRLQLTYETVVWHAPSKYGFAVFEPYYARPHLPQPRQ